MGKEQELRPLDAEALAKADLAACDRYADLTGDVMPHSMGQAVRTAIRTYLAALPSSDEQAEVVGVGVIIDALIEARNQIEYLHGKFAETGSGNAVMAKLDEVRRSLQSASPPAVAAGGVTEAQIKRAVDAALGEPENARRAADPDHPEADYAAGRVDAAQCVREALTAALAVGDEGIREGWQTIHTAKKDRTIILGAWPLDTAGKLWVRLPVFWDGDAWVAPWDVTGPHPVQLWCDLPALPTPPSRGEGV